MMLALVATAAAQHFTVSNDGYDEQSSLTNQCYWISVKQCLELQGVKVSVEDLRELVKLNGGQVNERSPRGCDQYEPDEVTHSILEQEYVVRIKVVRANDLTNPDVDQNPWEDYGGFSPRVMDTPDAPVCRIVHRPGHFELYADTSATERWPGKITPVHTPTSSPASSRSTARASRPPTTDARRIVGRVGKLEIKCQRHFANIEPLSSEQLVAMYEFARRAQVKLMGQVHPGSIASLPADELKSLEVALVRVTKIVSTLEA